MKGVADRGMRREEGRYWPGHRWVGGAKQEDPESGIGHRVASAAVSEARVRSVGEFS